MFHVNTTFVTDEGVIDFTGLQNGNEVNVYNEFGELEKGTIIKSTEKYNQWRRYQFKIMNTKEYPEDPEVVDDTNLIQNILTCGDEQWYLYNGNKMPNVLIGQSLRIAPPNTNNVFIDLKSKKWFAIGAIIANGIEFLYSNSKQKDGVYLSHNIFPHVYVNRNTYERYQSIFIDANYTRVTDTSFSIIEQCRKDVIDSLNILNNYYWRKCPNIFKADLFEGFYQSISKFKDTITKNTLLKLPLHMDNIYVKFMEDTAKYAGIHFDGGIDNFVGKFDNATRKYHYYHEIVLNPKYKRVNYRRFVLEYKDNIIDHEEDYGYTIDTPSKTFILENGLLVTTVIDEVIPPIV